MKAEGVIEEYAIPARWRSSSGQPVPTGDLDTGGIIVVLAVALDRWRERASAA
jgi:hypothetical protein